jgi:hypothetical protein
VWLPEYEIITSVSAGKLHSAAINVYGELYTWGRGFFGETVRAWILPLSLSLFSLRLSVFVSASVSLFLSASLSVPYVSLSPFSSRAPVSLSVSRPCASLAVPRLITLRISSFLSQGLGNEEPRLKPTKHPSSESRVWLKTAGGEHHALALAAKERLHSRRQIERRKIHFRVSETSHFLLM